MKMNVKKILKGALALFLTALMLFNVVFTAVGADKEKHYIKDVILIYAETLSEAKKKVPAGYTMMETDLNSGAEYVYDVANIYFAYSTTTDPDEAITDIRMMNMNGGYVWSDYDKEIDRVTGKVRDLADGFKIACDEFRANYKKGLSGAKAAYAGLNVFTVDEADGKGLGDYLLYSEVPDNFYLKVLLNVHSDILSTIFTALAMGIQGDVGNTWIDRFAAIKNPAEVWDDNYWDDAVDLWPHFIDFIETYNSIDHELFRNGDGELKVEDEETGEKEDVSASQGEGDASLTGNEIFYEIAYEVIRTRTFGNEASVSDWIMNEDLFEEDLYPLISVLTPGELAMMQLVGPMYMLLATSMDEDVAEKYISELEKELPEGFDCSIWYGVDKNLFMSSIGITDDARKEIAQTEAEREFSNDGDTANDTLLKTTGLVASVGAVVLGVGVVLTSIGAGSFAAALTGATYSAIGIVTCVAGTVCIAIGIIILVVALVMVIVYLAIWLSDWWDEHHPDYTDIPEYMYDVVVDESENTQFVLYEAVRCKGGDQDGKPADVNDWDGKQWHAMYVSRDKAAGNPIEADVKIRFGDGRIDEGYQGVRAFGSTVSENLNRYADSDDVGGIYMSFRQEPQEGDFAKGKYLSDIKIFTENGDEKCKNEVKKKGYTLYNYNLTPGHDDQYTYLGYKTTNSKSRALTDIRFTYGYTAAQYNAGGATGTYAASGTVNNLTLFTTRVSIFGTPILSDFLIADGHDKAPAGYEPVNFFSGGPAVNVNVPKFIKVDEKNQRFIFFLPSVTYTEGTEYLGGIASLFDVIGEGTYTSKDSVEKMIEHLGYETYLLVTGISQSEAAVVYTTTYNPYRAIYGVTAVSSGGMFGEQFSHLFNYRGISYSLATRYIINPGTKAELNDIYFKNNSRLYTTGIYNGGTPMTPDMLRVSKTYFPSGMYVMQTPSASTSNLFGISFSGLLGSFSMPSTPDFYPVSACLSNNSGPADLSEGHEYDVTYGPMANYAIKTSVPSMYVYTKQAPVADGNYVTGLHLSSAEDLIGNEDIDCDDLDKSYIMANLAASGATKVFNKNLNLEDSDNATYLGITKDANAREKLTDILLYYAGNTNKKPAREIIHKKITYTLVSDINLICDEGDTNAKCKRVYLYATSNPAAGAPIVDITIDMKPIINGMDTVRTQDGRALHVAVDDYRGDSWYIHIKRAGAEPKYIEEIVVGVGDDELHAFEKLLAAGCNYFVDKDLNDNVGAASDYIYVGYKKTNDASKAIRDLCTTHDNEVDTVTKKVNGNTITYTKLAGNLNAYTYAWADDIFLYYTKDSRAGAPLTDLIAVEDNVMNTTVLDINYATVYQHNGKLSDLNDNCGFLSDTIYLVMCREASAVKGTSSMIGEGSLIAIIVFLVVFAFAVVALVIYNKKISAAKTGA